MLSVGLFLWFKWDISANVADTEKAHFSSNNMIVIKSFAEIEVDSIA